VPAAVDDIGDEDFAAMVRVMQAEAAEIERAQRRAARG
jgi:hypothetical protein